MKQYTFRLGNAERRKGHRADCEHVTVVLEVTAENTEDALAELRVGNATLVSYDIGGSKGLPDPVCVYDKDAT